MKRKAQYLPYGGPDKFQCPFGVRDMRNDECYSGNGKNRCEFFGRYVWEGEHFDTVECFCNLPKVVEELKIETNSFGENQYLLF